MTAARSPFKLADYRLWRRRSAPVVLALSAVIVALATALRLALDPVFGSGYVFITYFLGVILAAALSGLRGAGMALLGSTVAAWWFFLPPQRSFALVSREEVVALLVFLVTAGLCGLVAAGLRHTLCELEEAERNQRLLIDELNHRVKNTLATVQSLAAQSVRSADSPVAFEKVFEGRLRALARAHDLLTQENWRGAELGSLIRETLSPYDPDGTRISIEGPPVRLSPNAAVTVNLAVHELATNAAKYGALSTPAGRVAVDWALAGAPADRLHFSWREAGVEGLEPPSRQGFGSRLLKAVARELDAEVEPGFSPGGLSWVWRVPLSAKVFSGANAAQG